MNWGSDYLGELILLGMTLALSTEQTVIFGDFQT
jgi:hypothetical protein